jgi:hypothetical protein
MSSHGVISSKQTKNNPGLCPIKNNNRTLVASLGPEINSSLSLCTTRTTPQYQTLVIHPAFYLYSYVLPRDPQEKLWSNKHLDRTVSCELVGSFITSYPACSGTQYSPTVCRVEILFNAFWHSYRWGPCFSSLKCFQSRLAIRASTNIFLWPILNFSYMHAD